MKYSVGQKLATYITVPQTEQEKNAYKGHEDKLQFQAYSVGNESGQVAIFPTDDFGEEQALKHAQNFCNLLNGTV